MTDWAEAYSEKKLKLIVEATTHCNAKCPQCQRTNPNGLDKQDWLKLSSWSLENFTRYFNKEDIIIVG